MCFGGSQAANTNVTPAPYSLDDSQSAVTQTTTPNTPTPSATPLDPTAVEDQQPKTQQATGSSSPAVTGLAVSGM